MIRGLLVCLFVVTLGLSIGGCRAEGEIDTASNVSIAR